MTTTINLIIFALIAATIWFFFMKKEAAAQKVKKKVTIVVDGGYKPSVIEVPAGEPVTLAFHRKDPTTCLEEVVIPDFHIRQFLPLNQTTEVQITPQKLGEYQFHCGMSMFFGKIIVV